MDDETLVVLRYELFFDVADTSTTVRGFLQDLEFSDAPDGEEDQLTSVSTLKISLIRDVLPSPDCGSPS